MNELLAQAYGTEANIQANSGDTEKTAEAVLLEELEKIATAEGIDLNEFDDNDILEIITEAMGETEKTAAAEGDETTETTETTEGGEVEEGEAKLAEADFLGRTMAHAFYDELTSIQTDGTEKTAGARKSDHFLKTAGDEAVAGEPEISPEVMQQFEDAALTRAQEILDFIDTDGTSKQSSAFDDEELETAVMSRAGELLNEAGYDVNAIAQAIYGDQ